MVLCGAGRRRVWLAGWVAAVAAGWIAETARHVPRELAARHAMSLQQEKNVRAFLITGAFPPGASNADLSIPYPFAGRLEQLLSDPRVRRLLPSIFQDAVASAQAPAAASPGRDRLGGIRDALLRAGRYLTPAGLLLLVVLMFARPTTHQSCATPTRGSSP